MRIFIVIITIAVSLLATPVFAGWGDFFKKFNAYGNFTAGNTQRRLPQWKSSSTDYIIPRISTRKPLVNEYCINSTTPDCITAWPSGGGASAWEKVGNNLQPTSTLPVLAPNGFQASSTVLFLHATTTDTLSVGTKIKVSSGSYISNLEGTGLSVTTGTLNAEVQTSDLHSAITLAGTPNYLTLSGQEITLTVLDINDDTDLTVASPLSLSAGGQISLSTAGDWTGTFDGQEGTYYLNWDNFTNKPATTTDFLALGDLSDVATTTATLGNVLVLQGTGKYDNKATSTLNIAYGDLVGSPSLFSGSWDDLTGKPATSTILNFLDTQKRISVLNATTTNTDVLKVYTSVDFPNNAISDAMVSDTLTASTLAANGSNCSPGEYPLGVDASGVVESCTDATTEIDSAILTHNDPDFHRPTTSLDYWFTNTAGINTDGLSEGSTNKYYTDARVSSYITGSSTVPSIGGCSSGQVVEWNGSEFVCATDDSGTGLQSWNDTGFSSTAITPTTTNAGIWVTASSTINANLRVTGNLIAPTKVLVSTTTAVSNAKVEIANYDAAETNGNLRIYSRATGGGDYDIRIDSPNPDIEFIDLSETAPAGRFEFATQGDYFQFTGRSGNDANFEGIMYLERIADGGRIGINDSTPDAQLDIVASSTNDYLYLSSGSTGNGDILSVENNGVISIGGWTNPAATTGLLQVNSNATSPSSIALQNTIAVGTGTGGANATNKFLGQFGWVSRDSSFSNPKLVAYIGAEATETYAADTDTGSLIKFYTGANNGTNPAVSHLFGNASSSILGNLTVTGNTTLNTISYTWPGSDGSNGQVLHTNGSGVLSWAADDTAAGGGAPGAWEQIFTGDLTPTSTSAGIFVKASSTFDSTLRVNGLATTSRLSIIDSNSLSTVNTALTLKGNRVQFGPQTYPANYVTSCPNCLYMSLDRASDVDDVSIVFRSQGNARGEIGLIGDSGADNLVFKTITGTYPNESFSAVMVLTPEKNVGIGTTTPTHLLSVGTNNDFTVDYVGNVKASTSITIANTAGNGVMSVSGKQASGGGSYIRVRDDTQGTYGYFGQNSVINGGTAYSQLSVQNPQSAGTICLSAGARASATAGTNCDLFFDSAASSIWFSGDARIPTLNATTTNIDNLIVNTSAEIPNGSAPTVDSIGEIAFDSTDNQLLIATSTQAAWPAVFGMEKLWSVTVASTSVEFVSGGSLPIPAHRDAVRIKELYCGVEGGTSIVLNISSSGGTQDIETLTCDTNGASDTNITTNNAIGAQATTTLEFGTVTGSPDYLWASAWGWRVRE